MPRVSVHRANLEAGDPRVVLIEWDDGTLEAVREVTFHEGATLRKLTTPTQYGATVVIEGGILSVKP